jgi:hypothetical protein
MFETDVTKLAARRVGRIVFGVVLIAGAFALVFRSRLPFSAAQIMIGSWSLAFAAALIVGHLPIREPRKDLFKTSIVVPSIGVALMLPLLVHMPFVFAQPYPDYDGWVQLSVYIVGMAHVAFALTSAIRASQLVDDVRALSPWAILGIVFGVSCVPFALLYMIPPVLVALTSIPILPLFFYQAHLVRRERAAVTTHLPRAIAYAV